VLSCLGLGVGSLGSRISRKRNRENTNKQSDGRNFSLQHHPLCFSGERRLLQNTLISKNKNRLTPGGNGPFSSPCP
jgi:hypothetical protein